MHRLSAAAVADTEASWRLPFGCRSRLLANCRHIDYSNIGSTKRRRSSSCHHHSHSTCTDRCWHTATTIAGSCWTHSNKRRFLARGRKWRHLEICQIVPKKQPPALSDFPSKTAKDLSLLVEYQLFQVDNSSKRITWIIKLTKISIFGSQVIKRKPLWPLIWCMSKMGCLLNKIMSILKEIQFTKRINPDPYWNIFWPRKSSFDLEWSNFLK